MSFIYPEFIKENQFIEFTGPDGETLAGETKEDQIKDALSKLNAYVMKNNTIDNVTLQSWKMEADNDYPVFGIQEGTGTFNLLTKQNPIISVYDNGIEIKSENLSQIEVFNINGQKIMSVQAENNRVFICRALFYSS